MLWQLFISYEAYRKILEIKIDGTVKFKVNFQINNDIKFWNIITENKECGIPASVNITVVILKPNIKVFHAIVKFLNINKTYVRYNIWKKIWTG